MKDDGQKINKNGGRGNIFMTSYEIIILLK
jgi:hypothetical protein